MNQNYSMFTEIFNFFFTKNKIKKSPVSKYHPVHQVQGPLGRRADTDAHYALRMSDMSDLSEEKKPFQ